MSARYQDWLAQARRDLQAARHSLGRGDFEWSAFQARQAAEKVLKALSRYNNLEVGGHTLVHLLRRVQEFTPVEERLFAMTRELDGHHIRPRYPNSFPEGHPGEFYDEAIAGRAIEYAQAILSFVEERIS